MAQLNRLQHETSPYLLQHAANPVDWYSWGEEALERAKSEEKPILVSIGYSTCHWCHVMERESFEDATVAAFMNEHFINIKVDREERPDLDHIYMEACQAINGSGGWPLNAFLLPDGRPFFAGTYYPPRPAHNRPSWGQVLHRMHRAFTQERETVEQQARQLSDSIQSSGQTFIQPELEETETTLLFNPVTCQNVHFQLQQRVDREHGGFGGAPKFPNPAPLNWLLAYGTIAAVPEATEHAHFSLRKIIEGGIHDQLGGGFARYTVDREWLVPHFEKMLYDNAQLLQSLAFAYQQQPDPTYREAAAGLLDWLDREMQQPEGGYYSALDADSEGEEGKFYVWQLDEIESVLGPDRAAVFNYYYGVSKGGNWEGKNILWRAQSLEATADRFGLAPAALADQLRADRQQLLDHRAGRVRPGRDEKVLLSWNALLVSGLAAAYHAFGEERYRERAIQTLDFLLKAFQRDERGGYFHTLTAGRLQHPAYLDDYAYLAQALLDAYPLSYSLERIESARTIVNYAIEHFLDSGGNLFYFTEKGREGVPLRTQTIYDSALPAGNSVMVHNLQRLGILTGQTDFANLADRLLKPVVRTLEKYPSSFANWAGALLRRSFPSTEVAVCGPAAFAAAALLHAHYLPNTIVMAAEREEPNYPLLAGRYQDTDTRYFVCRDYVCAQPVDRLDDALKLI